MYTISIKTEFNAAHRLRGYHGKCESLHGHNWVVEVTLKSNKLNKSGMVGDFTDLKKGVNKFLEGLDHKYLNEIDVFIKENPTSESISRYIYKGLKSKYENLIKVIVWETPTASAGYEE